MQNEVRAAERPPGSEPTDAAPVSRIGGNARARCREAATPDEARRILGGPAR
ncbi:3-keto-5-aminohexanoate cleavage protein [Methylobacterium sp. J-076]|uniref:3-keto-5-aminohexanoate cleavage protein n=1 Tax=Methylobacterium sp. J-076 TaxID=2836655 RepID=UPI001FB8C4E0|nr:3-keto-5-aminohexanoate cleavage protein [Methylobacterium sp. J-076]MCJ2013651.1 3-keto-5-aminohexanoate cleavage protein [Methylobacterium sp. J-076]